MSAGGWQALHAARYAALRTRTDPYLLLADALGYPDHDPDAAGATGGAFDVAIEWAPEAAVAPPAVPGLTLHAAHAGSCFCTGRATPAAYAALVAMNGVRRVVQATALRAQRSAPPWQSTQAFPKAPASEPRDAAPRKLDRNKLLLGMIDSGCPFAHADLRNAAGGTRVRALWDQGCGAHWADGAAGGAAGGAGGPPSGFAYGRHLSGAELDARLALAPHDTDVYRACGYGPVLARGSHGAHSLGLMAGASHCLLVEPDAAAAADIAFVQLPHDVLSCVSVAALESRALDGCRYILQQAKHGGYGRVLISLGYESWVGPHDGSSWFERALDALITEANAATDARYPRVKVFLIAGNSKGRQAHAATAAGDTALDLQLAVPPAHEVPTWLELWMHEPAPGLELRITPPGSAPLPALAWDARGAWTQQGHAAVSVVMHDASLTGGRGCLMLLRIAPTQVFNARQVPAPHGLWRLQLGAGGAVLGDVHAYVGRADASLGSAPGRQARFVGRPAALALQDQAGTLNGHAGGSKVHVSGAFLSASFPAPVDRRGKAAAYSGSGPQRDGPRIGPDDALDVDDGVYTPGMLSMGNASGARLRLSGTSLAAPLRARIEACRLPRAKPMQADPELGREQIERP